MGKMKNLWIFTLTSIALLVAATPAWSLVITAPTVTECEADPLCFAGPSGPPAANPLTADIEALVGVSGLSEAYKQDVGAASDEGIYANRYTTTFLNTALDPEDAVITYIDGYGIRCPQCFLLVKDGASDPNFYVFDISSWSGTENIELRDFWVGQGAISHVTIFTTDIPEPGILLLLASGLLGIGLFRSKKLNS